MIASVPSRVTVATLDNFTKEGERKVDIAPGNTILWKCELPYSNPDPYVDYFKDGKYLEPTELSSRIKAVVMENVTYSNTGVYKCGVGLPTVTRKMSIESLNLRVTSYIDGQVPYFLVKPPSNYSVIKGKKQFYS